MLVENLELVGSSLMHVDSVRRQDKQQEKIYDRHWKNLLPILESVVDSLPEHQRPPILHAAILANAPLRIIKDIINCFEFSILQTDSLKRIPLVVALEEGLEWDEGLQLVLEATSVAQKQCIIFTAAQYGLKWINDMKELAETNAAEVMSGCDSLTGLRLFMVAAMGDNHDLSAIYGMMRMSPPVETMIAKPKCEQNYSVDQEDDTFWGEQKPNKLTNAEVVSHLFKKR